MENINNDIQQVFFELNDKQVAETLKSDFISGGVDAELISLKKVRNKDAYKLVIADGQNQITKLIRVLHGPEYDLDFPQIEDLLKIKIEF